MSALSVEVPFPVFYDRAGEPLENGYVWIGQANLNPQTNPIQVYFDKNLTQPAAQPLRTLAGYISNAGTPAQIYVDANNFSILVQDKNGTMVYNFPEGTGVSASIDATDVTYTPPQIGAIQETVSDALDVSVRNNLAQFPVNTEKVWISELGWNPSTDRIFGRTTPETATFAIGGHYDEYGFAGRNYKWGMSSWYTNPGTMPITNIDAVSQGWKVRGGGMASRQCGDDGDGHSLEILSGQWASRATVTTTNGSDTLAVSAVTFRGSKFCIGNSISGTNIPGGATIVSVTKGSQTITANAVETMTIVSGGSGYVVGDIVTLVGGTNTFPAQARVRTVSSGGVILTLLVIEGGNYTVNPSGTLNISGGSGSGATVTVTIINGGLGYPDSIQISAPATGSGSSNIAVLSADTMGIALLVSGSGDGGSDGNGNPNGRGIQFQSYGNAAFLYGIAFGPSALRSNGTGIRFTIGTARRGISFESYNLEQALRFSGGTAINIIQTTGVTCTGSVITFGSTTATNGINFAATNVFSGAAILLSGQNIDTDATTGMKIGLGSNRKIGFWNATPVVQPSAIPNAAGGTEIATINSILTALRNIGLIAI
jgi:hypothetical protein